MTAVEMGQQLLNKQLMTMAKTKEINFLFSYF
jgi:hypothetical protein